MTTDKFPEIADIRKRYERAEDYWAADRKAALEDLEFRAGAHWPEKVRAAREKDERPCLVLDKLSQYVRQIVNDGRQNRPSIKVRPVDGGADVQTAEVFQGLIRHIEVSSAADAAYDTALDGAATCGVGAFRILTEYAGNDTFDQEIVIRRIRNPLAVLIDPDTQEADTSDKQYTFVVEEMEKEAFERQWPGKLPQDWETSGSYGDWFGEKVRIAEYWWVKVETKKLHQLADGQIVDDEQLKQIELLAPQPGLVMATREIPQHSVWHCKMTGAEYLEEPRQWPGRYIPILLVWGNELDVAGRVTHSGIIRPGRDPQRLYNYSRSAFAERVALTPKAPWVAAEGQVEDYEAEWKNANTGNYSVLRYKPQTIGGALVPAPQRTSASDVPAGFAQDMQISEHDIQAAIGMYNASLGAPSNERSGKAILARQREGDVGTFHYHDNLNRAIRFAGRILVDLIPKIYDSTRVVRIMGYDGQVTEAQLEPQQPTASQQMGVHSIYNLSVGRYDVAISSGPSYNTLRQEAEASMARLVENNPEMMQVLGDIIFKNMDWPGAQELSERMKLLLPPEVKAYEQEKGQQNLPPEALAVVEQLRQEIERRDQGFKTAVDALEQTQQELQVLRQEVEVKAAEVRLKEREIEIKAFDAETKRLAIAQKELADERAAEAQRSLRLEQQLFEQPQQVNAEPQSAEFQGVL